MKRSDCLKQLSAIIEGFKKTEDDADHIAEYVLDYLEGIGMMPPKMSYSPVSKWDDRMFGWENELTDEEYKTAYNKGYIDEE